MNHEINDEFAVREKFQWIFMTLVIVALVILWGRDIIRIIDWKIPNEIREGANVAVAQAFVDGKNPYRNIIFADKAPNVFYMYPFLNNLIGAAVVKIMGLPSGLTLLILNFVWTFLTGLLIAQVVKYYTNHIYFSGIAFLMSHYCGWRYTNVSAFPDMLGIFLMTLILYFCTCKPEKMKSNRSTVLLSFITVLCFYSKQYTIIVAVPVFLFLLLKGYKKQCFLYTFTLVAGMGISALIVYFTMPLYFVETLLMVGGSADNELRWAVTQFIKIGKLFFLELLFIIIYFIYGIRVRKLKLNYVWLSFGTMAAALFYFGQNNGAHLSYYLQLWVPSVIIVSMCAANEFMHIVKRDWQQYLIYAVIFWGAVYPAFFLYTPLLKEEQKENWDRVIEIADGSQMMLATPQMADYAVYNRLYMYDYGQNQYIFRKEMDSFWEKAEEAEWIKEVFPEIQNFREIHEQYRQGILKMLDDKKYDVLMLVPEVGFTRDFAEFEQIKKERYELVETIEIETGVWKWDLEVWR